MGIIKILLVFIMIFILFSCTNSKLNDTNTSSKVIKNIEKVTDDYRIVLNTLSDINKINKNTNILIINEEFWENNYEKIMNKILKYDFKKGPLLINIIGNGNNKYYKISEKQSKLFSKVKSETFVLLYNNGEKKGIVICDEKIKKFLGDKDYICGN